MKIFEKTLYFSLFLALLGTASSTFALCVNTSTANLRAGPSTGYEKVWTVYKYMPLREIWRKGEWIKVKDIDGYNSWIYNSLISSDYHCAAIKQDKVNLREGPGLHYPKIGVANQYHSFKIIKIKGTWVYIEDEYRHRYWVARSLIWID